MRDDYLKRLEDGEDAAILILELMDRVPGLREKSIGGIATNFSEIPIWDSNIHYESGTKVLFQNKECFVFGTIGEKPSRFMPNVKFKDFGYLYDTVINNFVVVPFVPNSKYFGFCTNIDGSMLLPLISAEYNIGTLAKEVSIYEAIPELVPEGMRYDKESDSLILVLKLHENFRKDFISPSEARRQNIYPFADGGLIPDDFHKSCMDVAKNKQSDCLKTLGQSSTNFSVSIKHNRVWKKGSSVHIAACGCEFDNFDDCFKHDSFACGLPTIPEWDYDLSNKVIAKDEDGDI